MGRIMRLAVAMFVAVIGSLMGHSGAAQTVTPPATEPAATAGGASAGLDLQVAPAGLE